MNEGSDSLPIWERLRLSQILRLQLFMRFHGYILSM